MVLDLSRSLDDFQPEKTTADRGFSAQVFNKFSATLGVPGEYRIESKEAHMSLTKPDTDGSNGVSMACGDSWGCKVYSLYCNLKADEQS